MYNSSFLFPYHILIDILLRYAHPGFRMYQPYITTGRSFHVQGRPFLADTVTYEATVAQ